MSSSCLVSVVTVESGLASTGLPRRPVTEAAPVTGIVSVGYFLNLIQIICVQSFYLLIWERETARGCCEDAPRVTHKGTVAGRQETEVPPRLGTPLPGSH